MNIVWSADPSTAETDRLDRIRDMITDDQRIALGLRPRTLRGWWFWLRYYSPIAWH